VAWEGSERLGRFPQDIDSASPRRAIKRTACLSGVFIPSDRDVCRCIGESDMIKFGVANSVRDGDECRPDER
jgi:hypothetical protein